MPTIKPAIIVKRVRRAVKPPNGIGVKGADKLEKHFVPLDTKALAGMLNRRKAFRKDGLKLRSEDTKDAKIIKHLDVCVRNWYKDNGWAVE